MKNLSFRKATDIDSEFAYQTKKIAFKEYVEKVWGWDENEQLRLHERRFTSQDFRVIQLSGEDIGILATVRETDYIKVNQIYILPEYQSQGIGKECMLRIIHEAAELKIPVKLQVLKVNKRAKDFYLRLGFIVTGESDTHFQMERTSLA